LLNYFDSLAVGVAEGVYIEQIVQDNLRLVIELAVDKFMIDSFAADIDFAGLAHLAEMRRRWRPAPATHFNAGTKLVR
jgi:hypothetical protein